MQNLRIPGPTPCPDDVLKAMSWPMVNHRGPEFCQLLSRVTKDLKKMFMTNNDVFLLTGSGTGGMEAAVVNTLSPGDTVMAISIGAFGDRFAEIARQFGAEVIPLNFDWGKAADIDTINKALRANPRIKAVLVTHNETSTGVTNDLETISSIVKSYQKLLLVDAVSSLGSINMPVDEWQCDVTVTGSQKGWMVPPGLAMVSVSREAWEAHSKAKMPRLYWDFTRAKKFLEKGQTPWTPAMSVIFALSVSLEKMVNEGLDSIIIKHRRIAQKTRNGIKELGLSLFADEKYASNTVTAVAAPDGLDVKELLGILRGDYNIILGGGQRHLAGKIFRIGHLGWVNEDDIDAVLDALKEALPKAGFKGNK